MKILIACEYSGVVRDAFRKLGHDAWSCDLLPCDVDPTYHYQCDVFDVIDKGWDMMIAHPPCTYLCVSGASWFYNPADKHLPVGLRRSHPKYPNRRFDQEQAYEFFMKLARANIPKIAVENSVGIVSRLWRKPDQIIQPWQFGDEASKSTCLWLKNLPLLTPTKIVSRGEFIIHKSGKKTPKWYADALRLSPIERMKVRSKTFLGVANAMAEQWGITN